MREKKRVSFFGFFLGGGQYSKSIYIITHNLCILKRITAFYIDLPYCPPPNKKKKLTRFFLLSRHGAILSRIDKRKLFIGLYTRIYVLLFGK